MVANNGQDFIEDTSAHTGVWYGFTPGASCKISAITVTNASGDSIDETHADWTSLVGTTNDLHCFVSGGLVGKEKGYITSITLSSGTAMMHRDTLSK